MARVYLDTTFFSFCVSVRTDPVSEVWRTTSREWWNTQASRHELFASLEVVRELSHPSFKRATEGLALVERCRMLDIDRRVVELAEMLMAHRVMPSGIGGDAVHVAACCVHGIEFLISWNVRHLANPNKLAHLATVCKLASVNPPRIITPDFLWE